MNEKPLFSIIVVSLNAGALMQKTMQSIQAQTCMNYEVVVKDGYSKDDTLDYVPMDDRIRVYQEKDCSIYDAMNQAVAYSHGKYLIFMNCGDYFADSQVLEKVEQFAGKQNYAMIYGDYRRDGIEHRQPTSLTPFYLYRTPLCHQSIFFNGEMMRSGHLYDTQYRILADYNLELLIFGEKKAIAHISACICDYAGGGVSESKEGIIKKRQERKLILQDHFTTRERVLFGVKFNITLPKLRGWIISDRSPKWVRNLYQKLVNQVNK